MSAFDREIIRQVKILAHETVLMNNAVKEKYGKDWKSCRVIKRNKKTFVIEVELKDGTVEQLKAKYD